jgi:hypothetical protein
LTIVRVVLLCTRPKSITGPSSLQRFGVGLAGADADGLLDRRHKYLAVADLPGLGGRADGVTRRPFRALLLSAGSSAFSREPGIGKFRLTAALMENVSLLSRTFACATFALRNTPTALSTRSSARWIAPLDLRTRTARKPSSTSSMRCLQSASRHARTHRSLLKCCHCQANGCAGTGQLQGCALSRLH